MNQIDIDLELRIQDMGDRIRSALNARSLDLYKFANTGENVGKTAVRNLAEYLVATENRGENP